jgi:hypothetical protein
VVDVRRERREQLDAVGRRRTYLDGHRTRKRDPLVEVGLELAGVHAKASVGAIRFAAKATAK